MRKDTVCVDLDGTLANIDHRVGLLQRSVPDWDGFYAGCVNDTPNEWCVALMEAMIATGHDVIIVSARSRIVEVQTLQWLRDKTTLGRHLDSGKLRLCMLRGPIDYTPDTELKRNWLNEFGRERILFVVDDRTKVVKEWRSLGLVCLQCAEWEEYKRPKKEKPNASTVA